jgi:hypothetical protein
VVHELKCWPQQFEALLAGVKAHEVRKRDRDFRVGDQLKLREWEPLYAEMDKDALIMKQGKYTGREQVVTVGWITEPGCFGLPADVCVMTVLP